ncbi:MAG: zinc ABC transporter solute-binding protein [Gammaproteobacteria bacterium]|nr:zinc ABC transporter solute-binding protein [Gammaproteobacteria bacterium]
MAALLASAAPAVAAGPGPQVVVTVKPVHALVAAVMEGVAEPYLLIDGVASPHTYALRPSQARRLERAHVVFWVGESLETFFVRTADLLAERARVVEIMRHANLRHGEPHHHTHAPSTPRAGDIPTLDPHVWLDPRNALAIAGLAANVLVEVDPANAPTYVANTARLRSAVNALEAEIDAQLDPVRAVPFVVFHDAYSLFARRFGLKAAGALTLNPAHAPGARRVAALRETLVQLGVACVFTEPQFEPRLVRVLIEGTGVRTGVLDPLGVDIPAGPQAYPALMRRLTASLIACLGAAV